MKKYKEYSKISLHNNLGGKLAELVVDKSNNKNICYITVMLSYQTSFKNN